MNTELNLSPAHPKAARVYYAGYDGPSYGGAEAASPTPKLGNIVRIIAVVVAWLVR